MGGRVHHAFPLSFHSFLRGYNHGYTHLKEIAMLLPVLHLFNDGYLAAMPLILPFAADDIGISLGMVGLLGSILGFSGIVLALPVGVAASRFGTARLLSAAVLCYGIGFITLGFSRGTVSVFLSFVLSSIAFGVFHPVAFSAVARAAGGKSLGKDMGFSQQPGISGGSSWHLLQHQ